LRATVIDLPGGARVGREIIAAAGMSERVEHRAGDTFEAELGGPYDGALVFDILHHLTAEQTVALLARLRAAMKPGATLAVLDMFRSDARRQRASAAAIGLFFHLTSGADLPTPAELAESMRTAGFSAPKRPRSAAFPIRRCTRRRPCERRPDPPANTPQNLLKPAKHRAWPALERRG
jgi:cyclopropane fatty-acyl-phospholipid synthase-like methyltransferase